MKNPAALSRREFVGQVSLAAAAALVLPRGLRGAAPDRKLGVAVLGLGNYATHEVAPALEVAKHCRLAAVITGTPAKGAAWRKRYELPEGNVYSYETMARIADNPDIDIVYVVTPPGTHRDFVVAAAKAGKHVISEKPLAPTVAECDEMIAACKAAGKRFGVGYRLEFEPHHLEMVRLARDPQFGPFTKMRGGFGFHMGGQQWRINKKLAGGGPLPDVGVYVLQASRRAAGAWPVAVTARELPKTRPDFFTEVEEAIEWTAEYPGGKICKGWASYNDGRDDFHAESDGGNWVEIDPAYIYGGLEGRTSRGPMNVPNINQQAAQMDDFAKCVMEGRDTVASGEMGRGDIATIEAIYASAATGKRVEVKI
ncbi:MAG TPA: Gfo/Idh/MocA family oxidoreductase [Opitutus sp.]|nr:Gfo/Idh/MocA family oxidoreductase [Opitutus sp.]